METRGSLRRLLWILAATLIAAACAPAARPATSSSTAPPTAAAAAPIAPAAASTAPEEQAVASFYRGKTVRIVVGFAAGAAYDIQSRLLAKHMAKYVPGNPTIVVENKPGAGSILAANLVYKTEAKDGTVIGNFHEGLMLQQALGRQGIEFDAARFNWIGSTGKTISVCMARTDSAVSSLEDMLGGRELIVGTTGPGSNTHDAPLILNGALGTRFRLVPGYDGLSKIVLAVEGKEVDGLCVAFEGALNTGLPLLEGDRPTAKIFVISGAEIPDHPLLKGVPRAETFAKTDADRLLLRGVDGPAAMAKPFAVAPEVPRERVEALRGAFAQAFTDPQLLAEWSQASQDLSVSTAAEVTRFVQDVLGMPQPTIARLKEVLD